MSRLRSQKKLTLIGKLVTSWKIFHNDFKIVLFSKKFYHWWWRIWYIFYIHGGSLNRFYHFIDFIMVFFSFGIILNSSNILFRLRLWFHSFGIGFITFWWFRNWRKIAKRKKMRFYVLVDSKKFKSTPKDKFCIICDWEMDLGHLADFFEFVLVSDLQPGGWGPEASTNSKKSDKGN